MKVQFRRAREPKSGKSVKRSGVAPGGRGRSARRRHSCRRRRRNRHRTSSGVAPVFDHYSQTGLFNPPLRSFSTTKRTTVPSMTGSGPSWPSQAARRVSRGCERSQVCATALPKRRASATARRPRPAPVCRPQPSATAPRPRRGEARRRRSAPGRALRTGPRGPDGVPARAPGRSASVPARPYTTARRRVRTTRAASTSGDLRKRSTRSIRVRPRTIKDKLRACFSFAEAAASRDAQEVGGAAGCTSRTIGPHRPVNQHQGLCDSLPSPCQVALARIQHGRR